MIRKETFCSTLTALGFVETHGSSSRLFLEKSPNGNTSTYLDEDGAGSLCFVHGSLWFQHGRFDLLHKISRVALRSEPGEKACDESSVKWLSLASPRSETSISTPASASSYLFGGQSDVSNAPLDVSVHGSDSVDGMAAEGGREFWFGESLYNFDLANENREDTGHGEFEGEDILGACALFSDLTRRENVTSDKVEIPMAAIEGVCALSSRTGRRCDPGITSNENRSCLFPLQKEIVHAESGAKLEVDDKEQHFLEIASSLSANATHARWHVNEGIKTKAVSSSAKETPKFSSAPASNVLARRSISKPRVHLNERNAPPLIKEGQHRCLHCQHGHNGRFGSGKFCSSACTSRFNGKAKVEHAKELAAFANPAFLVPTVLPQVPIALVSAGAVDDQPDISKGCAGSKRSRSEVNIEDGRAKAGNNKNNEVIVSKGYARGRQRPIRRRNADDPKVGKV